MALNNLGEELISCMRNCIKNCYKQVNGNTGEFRFWRCIANCDDIICMEVKQNIVTSILKELRYDTRR